MSSIATLLLFNSCTNAIQPFQKCLPNFAPSLSNCLTNIFEQPHQHCPTAAPTLSNPQSIVAPLSSNCQYCPIFTLTSSSHLCYLTVTPMSFNCCNNAFQKLHHHCLTVSPTSANSHTNHCIIVTQP